MISERDFSYVGELNVIKFTQIEGLNKIILTDKIFNE